MKDKKINFSTALCPEIKMVNLILCFLFASVAFGKTDIRNEHNVPRNSTPTEAPLYNSYKYTGIDVHEFQFEREQARLWLLSQMREDYSWGVNTQRAIIALQLSDDKMVDVDSEKDMLISKQLHIELSLALARNATNEISLSDLSLYINALQATCSNPRNFHGFDLVSTLRSRVDVSRGNGTFMTPLVYLTLCLNNATTHDDLLAIYGMFSNRQLMDKTDILAVASLASTCIAKLPGISYIQTNSWIKKLLRKITPGMPENVYELALIVQALNAARVDPSEWNREDAIANLMKRQKEDGSFGDILATYYILPILSNKSLLSLSDHCHASDMNGLTPVEVLMHKAERQIHVNYALYFGEPVQLSQSMLVEVPEGTNFLDIMRLAQEKSPSYRFSLDENNGDLSVYSIGGIPNDAEKGMYWMPYVLKESRNANSESNVLEPYKKNIKDLVPKFGERLIFWMKPIDKV